MKNIEDFLKSLKNDVNSVKVVLPDKCRMMRNNQSVWPIRYRYPNKKKHKINSEGKKEKIYSKWSYLDTASETFRCAKIYKINISISDDLSRNVYWIEIEKRIKERGFCAFILKRADRKDASKVDIKMALRAIAKHKGNSSGLASHIKWILPSLIITPWVHAKNAKGELSKSSALAEIRA